MYGSQSYTYDGVGNRLTRMSGGVTDTYAYSPTANQVSTITTGSNVRSFSYLASGQVSQDVRDASHTYTFAANDNGRNASAALNGSTAGAYLYNAFEQRVQKVAGGVTTQLVFDRFGHLLAEADASGTVQKEYIWLDDLPVAMMDDTGPAPVRYYIHTDQLGTPQKITDGAANVVWDGQFDPFGNIIPISITPTTGGTNWGTGVWGSFNWALTPVVPQTNNLRFPGQYADAETGLNQNWNRDYDPTIGRYAQSDPIGLNGGINTYGYVLNSPPNLVDFEGTGIRGSILGGIIGGAIGAAGGSAIGPEGTVPGAWEGAETGSAIGSAAEDLMNSGAGRTAHTCPDPAECDRRNREVQNAKSVTAALGSCRTGMSVWQLRTRYTAWLHEATARAKRDQVCWSGGDPGHQQAQAQAWSNVGNCGRLMQ